MGCIAQAELGFVFIASHANESKISISIGRNDVQQTPVPTAVTVPRLFLLYHHRLSLKSVFHFSPAVCRVGSWHSLWQHLPRNKGPRRVDVCTASEPPAIFYLLISLRMAFLVGAFWGGGGGELAAGGQDADSC